MKRRALSLLAVLLLVAFTASACTKQLYTESNAASTGTDPLQNIDFSSKSVSADNLILLTQELTSDKYAGRLVGTPGNRRAARFISGFFSQIGLDNPEGLENYLYKYGQRIRTVESKLLLKDNRGSLGKSYENRIASHHNSYSGRGEPVKSEKVEGTPVVIDSLDKLKSLDKSSDIILFIPNKVIEAAEKSGYSPNTKLLSKNIKGIVFEKELEGNDEDLFPPYPLMYNFLGFQTLDTPIFLYVDSKSFKDILKSVEKGAAVGMETKSTYASPDLFNVVGLLKGKESPENGQIIIGAHFDHLGVHKNGECFPGAWDNATGTAVMMEVARVLAAKGIVLEKPVLFIAFNGEEQGLYGSRNYARRPVYPLNDSTIINIDSVGPKTNGDFPLTLASNNLAGEDPQVKQDLEVLCDDMGIVRASQTAATNTDHYSFAMSGIKEAVSLEHLFTTYWHTTKDTADKIDKDSLKKVADLIVKYIENISK